MCSNIRGVPRIIRISGHAARFTALSYKRPGAFKKTKEIKGKYKEKQRALLKIWLIAAEGSILIFTVFLWYPVLLAELYRVDVISIFALIQGVQGGLSFWKYSSNGTSHVRLNV